MNHTSACYELPVIFGFLHSLISLALGSPVGKKAKKFSEGENSWYYGFAHLLAEEYAKSLPKKFVLLAQIHAGNPSFCMYARPHIIKYLETNEQTNGN